MFVLVSFFVSVQLAQAGIDSVAVCNDALFDGGDGTEGDPWQIATAQQLADITLCSDGDDSGNHYILTDDIDLSDFVNSHYVATGASGTSSAQSWIPIGHYFDPDNGYSYEEVKFGGDFNGNYHTISNLTMHPQTGDVVYGLFAVAADSSMYDFALTDVTIDNFHADVGDDFVGPVAGLMDGDVDDATSIERVFVKGGDIDSGANEMRVGGLVGRIAGSKSVIKDSYVKDLNINANGVFGGVVSWISDQLMVENVFTIISAENEPDPDGFFGDSAGMLGFRSGSSELRNSFSVMTASTTTQISEVSSKWGDDMTNNFWYDADDSEESCSRHGAPTSTQCAEVDSLDDLKNATKEPLASWDIATTDEHELNDGYPFLTWEANGESGDTVWMVYGVLEEEEPEVPRSSGGGGSPDNIKTRSADINNDSVVLAGKVGYRDDWSVYFVYAPEESSTPTCREESLDRIEIDGTFDQGDEFTGEILGLSVGEYKYRACGERDGSVKSGNVKEFIIEYSDTESVDDTDSSENEEITDEESELTDVLTDAALCTPYITQDIRLGVENDITEVNKLITFLNEKQGETLVVDGTYDQDDYEAVKRFQIKFTEAILGIWDLSAPTGIVSITTRNKINSFYCPADITCPYFTEYNSLTENNSSDEVRKTKIMLRDLGFYTGVIDYMWGEETHTAMIDFQETFASTMLKPWNLLSGTGYKYQTTNRFLNQLVGCNLPPETIDNGAVISY